MPPPPPFDPRSIPLDGPGDAPLAPSPFDARAIPLEGSYSRNPTAPPAASAAPPADDGCPKCGWQRPVGDASCGRCGLIFARYAAQQQRARASTPASSSMGGAGAEPRPDADVPARRRPPGPLTVPEAIQAAVRGWSSGLSEWPPILFFNLVPSLVVVGVVFFAGLLAAFALTARSGGAGLALFATVLVLGAVLLIVRVAGACLAGTVIVLDDHAGGGITSRGFSEAFSAGWSMGLRVALSMTVVGLVFASVSVPAVVAAGNKAGTGSILLLFAVGVVVAGVLAVRMAFVLPAVVLDGEGPFGALQASFACTKGRFLPVAVALGVLGMIWLTTVAVGGVLYQVPYAGFVLSAIANAIATGFSTGGIVHLWRAVRYA